MARHLLASGVAVTVADPSERQRKALADDGASIADTLSDFRDADIVFATLPNDAALRAVVCGAAGDGAEGLGAVLRPGAAFVEMSTVSPQVSAEVAKIYLDNGIAYLRAPLSGSTAMAESASLTILASGDSQAWDMAHPFFDTMSAKHFYLGPGDEARFMKLVLNALVGASSRRPSRGSQPRRAWGVVAGRHDAGNLRERRRLPPLQVQGRGGRRGRVSARLFGRPDDQRTSP